MANINQRLNGLNPLSYIGDNAVQPPDFVTKARPPNSTDSKNFALGDIWLDMSGYPNTLPTNEDIYMLVALVGNTATWVNFGGGDLETLTGNSGGAVSPDGADNINILGDTTTINVVGNPGTNTLTISTVGTGVVNTLTGNSGGAVSPTAGNINVLGTGVITVVGNPGTSTLTITPSGAIASSFPTDSGTATPALGVLNVLGGTAGRDINTTGSGSTVRVHLNNAITLGDLAVIGANTPALDAVTGDVRIQAGNLVLPATGTNIAETAGCIVLNNQVFLNSLGGNCYLGYQSGNPGITVGVAVANVGIGNSCQTALTTGINNTGIGGATLQNLTTGSSNAALGFNALNLTTTGGNNTACGAGALEFLLTGSGNVALGRGAGSAFVGAEANNIIIGNSPSGTAGDSNKIRIGFAAGNASSMTKTFIDGIRGVTTDVNDAVAILIDSAGQLGTVSSSIVYKDNIKNMADSSSAIMNLRPVTFNYKADVHKKTNYGLIAEEVDLVMPELVAHDKDGDIYSVKYHGLIPLLLNEVQKLSKEVAELKNKLN